MFSPPKLKTISVALTAFLALSAINHAQAQNADYQRRLAAMQQARNRAQVGPSTSVRVASAEEELEYTAPPAPKSRQNPASTSRKNAVNRGSTSRNHSAPQRVAAGSQRYAAPQHIAQAPRSNAVASRYSPAHLRTAQLYDETVIDGGSPVIHGAPFAGGPGCTTCQGGGGPYETFVDDGYIGDGYIDDGYVDDGYYVDGGGCDSCGDCGSYFECGDPCCDRGGCPPGDCWLTGFGAILYNGEYFTGAQGFQNGLFYHPGGGDLIADCNFGFYGGMNVGIPLCKLTCGVFSGQIGFRSVQSNFRGNDVVEENRDQTFFTAGFYRRVDYGFQVGVVADILHEDWFAETTTIQVRSDLGWVWPGGTTIGFRYADSVQDDVEPGTIDGVEYDDIVTFSEDYYRFYMRKDICTGGYHEMYFGWTDSHQTIFGMETDVPITATVSAQSTFTYYLKNYNTDDYADEPNLGDSWNVACGFVWRPRGNRSYHRSYDRPLFNVADNGTMLMLRE